MHRLTVSTHRREEMIDVAPLLRDRLEQEAMRDGICVVTCPHTTAGLTVNEHADPSVADDLLTALDRMVPEEGGWTHAEGNSPAHVKTSLVGSSLILHISEGKLELGRWQGAFLCEFDGPRTRHLWVRFMA